MVLHLVLVAALGAGGPPASGPAGTSSAPAASMAAIDALVDRLGDPRFEVREQATQQLCQLAPAAMGAMLDRYRALPYHERKLRLRHAIETLYFRQLMEGEVGFLGIQLDLADNVIDPATNRPGECVVARRVLKDLPADQAGVRDGDIIAGFDDKPISWFFGAAPPPVTRPADDLIGLPAAARPQDRMGEKIERFTQHVKRRLPGSQVRLRVLRPASPARTITVAAAPEPARTLDGAVFVPVSGSMAGVSPMGATGTWGGLMAKSVQADSPAGRAGLKTGDIVTAIDRMPLPAEADPRILAQAFKEAAPGSTVNLQVTALQQVALTVTIGRRPVDRLNPGDLHEAQQRFAVWWRQQTGEDSIQPPETSGFPFMPPNPAQPATPEPAVVP
jgi:hypothetical protein